MLRLFPRINIRIYTVKLLVTNVAWTIDNLMVTYGMTGNSYVPCSDASHQSKDDHHIFQKAGPTVHSLQTHRAWQEIRKVFLLLRNHHSVKTTKELYTCLGHALSSIKLTTPTNSPNLFRSIQQKDRITYLQIHASFVCYRSSVSIFLMLNSFHTLQTSQGWEEDRMTISAPTKYFFSDLWDTTTNKPYSSIQLC